MKYATLMYGIYPRRQSRYRAIFVPLVAPIRPTIFVLGIFTLPRLDDAVIEYIHLQIGIVRICGYYRTLTPEVASFFSAESGQRLARSPAPGYPCRLGLRLVTRRAAFWRRPDTARHVARHG